MRFRLGLRGRSVAIVFLALLPASAVFAFAPTASSGLRLAAAAAALVFAMAVTRWFGERFVIRPLQALVRATEQLRGGDLSARTGLPHGDDEVSRLARSFDDLAGSLQSERAAIASADRARRTSEARFVSLVEAAADAIVAVDESQRIVLFNRGAEEIFGYRASEIVGRPLSVLMPARFSVAHRDHVLDFSREPKDSRRMGASRVVLGRRADGTEFSAEASIAKLTTEEGTTFTAILRDVTERQKLEERFLHAQRMESVGRLAGGVAHDFNNLLTAILGNVDVALKRMGRRNPLRENLEEARTAVQRGAGLSRQLLAFARRQPSRPRVLSLNELIANMERMLKRLIGEDIALVTDLVAEPWPVRADPGQFEQVLVNLVVNARDAMPDGGSIVVRTRNETLGPASPEGASDPPPGEYAGVWVEDTGTGMTAEVQAHLFEPFFTTKEVGKGTGLGLATCYGIVQGAGGHISVTSAPGRGASVRVVLPRVADEAAEKVASDAPSAAPRGTETLLVVDDDEAVRTVAAVGLRSLGYRVLEAGSGADALVHMEREGAEIPLALLDIAMPVMTGYELSERLHAIRSDLTVIFVTGYVDRAVTDQRYLPPDATIVLKPYSLSLLAGIVREALDRPARP